MIQGLNIEDEARRVFTDREEPMKVLEDALTEPQGPNDHRVRVWYGVGGQGKTALLNEFHRKIASRPANEHIVASVLDFANAEHRDPTKALLNIRRQLGSDRRISFPTFDLAFDKLYKFDHTGSDITAAYPDIFNSHQNEIAEFLEGLGHLVHPAVPWVGLIYRYASKLPHHLAQWWNNRHVKRQIGELEKYTAIELREKLPAFLSFDLKRAMQEEHSPRVVLMIDTYEALWRDATQGAMQNPRTDKWARTLIEDSPGMLVAIFSRDRLRWGEFDDLWDTCLEQHLLGGLSEEDATWFLDKAGVQPDSVRKRIVAGSQGLPFYLDLAVTHFQRLVARGRTVTAADFDDTPAELLHRFLDHLTDAERSELLLASYPDDVSESLFDALANAFPGEIAGVNWRRFTRHSFITQTDHDRASLHSLMREGLQSLELSERPDHFRRVHLWLFERYDKEAEPPPENKRDIGERHDRALLAAARHLAEVDAERLVTWIFGSRMQEFSDAGRYLALSAVLERISNVTGPHVKRVWEINFHLAHMYQFTGRNEDAKELYERARKIYDSLETGRDPTVFATILHAIADVCRALKEEPEAKGLYEEALTLYEGDPSRYKQRYAEVLFSLGSMKPDRTGAEGYFKRAQATFKSVAGDRETDYAEFLYRLAYAHYERKLMDEAEVLYREALDIYTTSPGDRHPYYADALLYLSTCVGKRNQTEAEKGFERAISVYSDALGPEHPKLGRGLHFQARFWIEDLQRREPAMSQLKRAIGILKNALGDLHDWTKQAHGDLLRLQG